LLRPVVGMATISLPKPALTGSVGPLELLEPAFILTHS
jgi:hypothetical protein